MIILITGAGGAGKSTLIAGLKRELAADKYDIHDIDEADRWGDNSNYPAWMRAKIEHYLEQSKKNDKDGIDTILCGIIFPQGVLNSEMYEGASARFILLDAGPDSIASRLRVRHKTATEDWLREAEANQAETALSLKKTFSDKPGVRLRERPSVELIDTTHLSPDEVLSKVKQLLHSSS